MSPSCIFADEDTEVQGIYAAELMSSRERIWTWDCLNPKPLFFQLYQNIANNSDNDNIDVNS